MTRGLVGAALILILHTHVDARVVISEVMFDPEGSEFYDEFVELQNVGTEPVDLGGWRIGDGDEQDELVPVDGGSVLAPSAFALILDAGYFDHSTAYDPWPADALVMTIEDATFGKGGFANEHTEAVILHNASGVLIGSVTYSPGNAAGYSEEKIDPLGGDGSENWADSRWKLGTPGRVNSVSPKNRDLALEARTDTPVLVPGGLPGKFTFEVVNRGRLSSGESEVVVEGSTPWRKSVATIGPGESLEIDYVFHALDAGSHRFEARVSLKGDEDPLNDAIKWEAVSGALPQQILVNEVMAAPAEGGPEWVELVNPSAGDVDLSGWRLGDSGDKVAVLDADKIVLSPGGFLILAKDDSGFLLHHELAHDARVYSLSGWRTLNDGGDEVVLRDATGAVIDRMRYGDTTPGRSLERIDLMGLSEDPENWLLSTDPAGATAGGENSVAWHPVAEGVALQVSPNPFKDRVEITYQLPDAKAVVNLWIFDRSGRRVSALLNAESGGSRRVVWWDGTGEGGRMLKPGIYVVYLEAISSAGTYRQRVPVVLARGL